MIDHLHKFLWPHRISNCRQKKKESEQENVQSEYATGDIMQPSELVWQVLQQNSSDACAHVHSKPAAYLSVLTYSMTSESEGE